MDLNFSPEEEAFRLEVRESLEQAITPDMRQAQARGGLPRELQITWQKRLHERGWAGINWPVEYGGTGWSPAQKHIFHEEMAEANAPTVIPFGLGMVAPVIYTYGSEEQKQRFLPDILASDVWWCQGYSEPGAGSDLAALQTKAERRNGHYLVNGAKTWTTLAQHADWIFCLVRTSTEERRQQGISFLLVNMDDPGVSVEPIITLEGGHEVNSVYFTDVEVPVENLIGEEGQGWTYAKVLLQHERTGIAGVKASKRELRRLRALAAETQVDGGSLLDDGNFARELAELEIELTALEYTDLRVLASVATGGAPGPESSILKIRGTEIQQRLTELFVELAGYYAIPYTSEGAPTPPGSGNLPPVGPEFSSLVAPRYFNMRKASIYGGSNEIQKNIIAKAVLQL